MALNAEAFDALVNSMNIAAGYQAAGIQEAINTTKEINDKNLTVLQQQFDQARADISPLLNAAQIGTAAFSDFLGLNGPEAQQAYVNSLVSSGSSIAAPAVNLINQWNAQQNPTNIVSNLLGLGQQVGQANFPGMGQGVNFAQGAGYTPTPLTRQSPSSIGYGPQSQYQHSTPEARQQYRDLLSQGTPQAFQQAREMLGQYGAQNLASYAGQVTPNQQGALEEQLARQGLNMEDYNRANANLYSNRQVIGGQSGRPPGEQELQAYQQNLQLAQQGDAAAQGRVQDFENYFGQQYGPNQASPSGQLPPLQNFTPGQGATGINAFANMQTSTGTPNPIDYQNYGMGVNTTTGIPDAPDFEQLVQQIYNNPAIANAIEKEIGYGTRNTSNQLAARGLASSGREQEELARLGQGIAQSSLSEKLAQATGLASNTYGQQLSSDTSQRLGALSAAQNAYGQQLSSDTQQRVAALQAILGSATSGYSTSTNALASNYGSAYGTGISANQNALGNLLNTGLGAAQSTANIATGLGQAIAGQNTMTGANLSNAYLQQGNVMSNLQSNLGTLAFQRALSGGLSAICLDTDLLVLLLIFNLLLNQLHC